MLRSGTRDPEKVLETEGKPLLSQCFPLCQTPQDVIWKKVFLPKVWESLDFSVSLFLFS